MDPGVPEKPDQNPPTRTIILSMKYRIWMVLTSLLLIPIGCGVTEKSLAGEWDGDATVGSNASPMMQALLRNPQKVTLILEAVEDGTNHFTLKQGGIPVATGTWVVREDQVFLYPREIMTPEGLNPNLEAIEWIYKPESSRKLVLVSPAPEEGKAPRAFTR
jgi:hypothetical protein